MSEVAEALIQPVRAGTPAHPGPGPQSGKRPGRKLIIPVTATLVIGAWFITRQNWYSPGSDLGYYMGLVGSIMMLLLLLYPLRKHVGFMQSWGASKHWFRAHMVLGISGPTLILLHSTFHIGSLNAGVALTCMLVVAGSGVIGRFFYTKIHNGLYGRRASLKERQEQLGISAGDVKSRFHALPGVEQQLKNFAHTALEIPHNGLVSFWHFLTLRLRARWVRFHTGRDIARTVRSAATQKRWNSAEIHARTLTGKNLVSSYLDAVCDTAQFSTYERLFSLWHVLHVPFVYMLVISAIFHVIAVHMY